MRGRRSGIRITRSWLRARDSGGNTQPFAQEWNPSGYGWNVVPRINLQTSVSTTPGPDTVQVVRSESAEINRSCVVCHGADVIQQQHLTRAQWDREITKMTNWGAQVKPEDRNSFLDFLTSNYGPTK